MINIVDVVRTKVERVPIPRAIVNRVGVKPKPQQVELSIFTDDTLYIMGQLSGRHEIEEDIREYMKTNRSATLQDYYDHLMNHYKIKKTSD